MGLGFSQERMGRRAGVLRFAVSKWENNKLRERLPIPTIHRISKALCSTNHDSQAIKDIYKTRNLTKENPSEKDEILLHPKYICGSYTIVNDSLRKGHDVVQMPNGDIIIKRQEFVVTRYGWDRTKEKMVKVSIEIEDNTILPN